MNSIEKKHTHTHTYTHGKKADGTLYDGKRKLRDPMKREEVIRYRPIDTKNDKNNYYCGHSKQPCAFSQTQYFRSLICLLHKA